MATGYIDGTTMRIDFTDDTWLNAFPDIYSFTNTSSVPWGVDSTFQYEEKPTLRSGAIGHNNSTALTLTFTLTAAGSVTFPYCIISERSFDWLNVVIDGTQRIHVSGTYQWTNYTWQLDAGEHTIVFTYSKDGSTSTGVDACGIGYIDISGVRSNFNTYYLVHDLETGNYFANIDGSLTATPLQAQPTLQDFVDYGGLMPTAGMLDTMYRFELLKCADTVDLAEYVSGIEYSIVGNIKPELLKCSNVIRITEQYQTGFKSVSIIASKLDTTEIYTIISPDNNTWYAYNANTSAWEIINYDIDSVLASGMTTATLALLNEDIFAALYTEDVPKVMYIAFAVKCIELDHWYISDLRIAFTAIK